MTRAPVAVSVVIATRNRPESVAAAVRSVLETSGPAFELLVADQSSDGATEDRLKEFAADHRVVHVALGPRPGLSRARNDVIARARGEIIAITDDDCEVAPDWLDAITRAFTREPGLGVLFGNVSWDALCRELSNPLKVFCYPTGRMFDFGPREIAYLEQAGFLGATSSISGLIDSSALMRNQVFSLPRISLPDSMDYFIQYCSWIERSNPGIPI